MVTLYAAPPTAPEHPRAGRENGRAESPPDEQRPRLPLVEGFANLHGKDIRGALGEKLGEVADVVVDVFAGEVPYVLVASRAAPAEGYRLRLVPTGALQDAPRGGGFMVPFQGAQWRNLESIDSRQLEAGALRAFETHRQELARVFGFSQARAEPSRLLLATHLLGKEIRNGGGSLGTLKAILAASNRRTALALVRVADASQPRTVIVPVAHLQLPAFEAEYFGTDLTREDLERAQAVDINLSAALAVSTDVRRILAASMLSQSSMTGQKGYAGAATERGPGAASPTVPITSRVDQPLSPTGKSNAEASAAAIEAALAAVRKALAAEPAIRAASVEVEVRGAALRLSGSAPNAATRARAEEIARKVAPAAALENAIVVAPR